MTTVKTRAEKENLVEHLMVQGKLTPVRRYWLGDHVEFRFAYRDPATRERRFKCNRSIEGAREAAKQLQEPVLTPAQAQAAAIEQSVRKAVTDALGHIPKIPAPAPVEQITFADVATRFLVDKEQQLTAGELRPASYRDLLTRTEHLKKAIGGVSTSNLKVSVLDAAIRSLPAKSARSVWNYRVTLRSILIWGRDRNLAPANIIQVFKAMSAKGDPKKDAEKINPFTTEEVKVILDACLANRDDRRGTQLAAAIALQAFCGVRSRESCVVQWTDIDLEAGLVRLKAENSKVGRNRPITLPENARSWLNLVTPQLRRGPLCPGNYWDSLSWVQKRARQIMPEFKWRPNGLRQGFISHHLAQHDKITDTAYLAGNSPEKIRTNYWRLKTKEQADQYFNIRPNA